MKICRDECENMPKLSFSVVQSCFQSNVPISCAFLYFEGNLVPRAFCHIGTETKSLPKSLESLSSPTQHDTGLVEDVALKENQFKDIELNVKKCNSYHIR